MVIGTESIVLLRGHTMSLSIEEQQDRIKKLFGHGNMSYHLAKLLEEAGELAKVVNKSARREEIADEIADVLIATLIFSGEYNFRPLHLLRTSSKN